MQGVCGGSVYLRRVGQIRVLRVMRVLRVRMGQVRVLRVMHEAYIYIRVGKPNRNRTDLPACL